LPSKPKKPCNYPGCPNLTQERYCQIHNKAVRNKYDKNRGSSTERGYGYRWRKESKQFLFEHPLCECDECKRMHRLLPSEVVDHIIPHRGDPILFWDKNNWRAMSKRCHDQKTAREDNGFGNHSRG
jgi:5-methylcytosine-specific restriction enzyme A